MSSEVNFICAFCGRDLPVKFIMGVHSWMAEIAPCVCSREEIDVLEEEIAELKNGIEELALRL